MSDHDRISNDIQQAARALGTPDGGYTSNQAEVNILLLKMFGNDVAAKLVKMPDVRGEIRNKLDAMKAGVETRNGKAATDTQAIETARAADVAKLEAGFDSDVRSLVTDALRSPDLSALDKRIVAAQAGRPRVVTPGATHAADAVASKGTGFVGKVAG